MKQTKLMLGDNIESLKKLPENSIDSIVTDPPYGLSFMNKKWDYQVPSIEFWKEVYRVLKPGGHVLSFGGTRTYHRMVVNMEDAGFEIRDQIMWLYGSGFPKSLNIGKAVDKLQGNKREVVGNNPNHRTTSGLLELGFQDGKESSTITKGQSEWEGWGTALKPANEPICLARKPLAKKTIVENVLEFRTGGLNIDGCRVGIEGEDDRSAGIRTANFGSMDYKSGGNGTEPYIPNEEGRFPANVILECLCDEVIKGEKGEVKISNRKVTGFSEGWGDVETKHFNDKGDIHTNPECPCYIMDQQTGILVASYATNKSTGGGVVGMSMSETGRTKSYPNDKGGASRFFYQAKVSKSERNMGLDDFEDKENKEVYGKGLNTATKLVTDKQKEDGVAERDKVKNNHPTLKPVNLMSYLCRLITPPGGIVLDPFMGSGSTGIAAQLEGFRFVGMEMDPEYFKIAEARIDSYEKYKKFVK